jgi:membrane associated rhomboid family serine protease
MCIKAQQEFYQDKFKFSYLERLKNNSDVKHFNEATNTNKWTSSDENILLIQKQGKYDDRNGGSLGWIFKSTGIAILALLLLLLCFRLKTTDEWNRYTKKIQKEKSRGWQKNYEYLIPQNNFFVTPIIAYINILVFLWLVFTGAGFVSLDGEELIKFGSMCSPNIKLGDEYWRFFTYMFLHGGIMHLANNLISLFFVSMVLEPIMGRWRFLTVYILCGIGAGISSYYWHDEINSVGASGAIFGIYGFLLMIVLTKVVDKTNTVFLWISGISLGFSMIMGIFGNIDNAAHIGGLITGGLLGLVATPFLKSEKEDTENEIS